MRILLLDLTYCRTMVCYPVIPKFSAPLAAKLRVRPPQVVEVQRRAQGPLPPCQVWWGSDFGLIEGYISETVQDRR